MSESLDQANRVYSDILLKSVMIRESTNMMEALSIVNKFQELALMDIR